MLYTDDLCHWSTRIGKYIMPHAHPAGSSIAKRIHILFRELKKFHNFESRNNKTKLYEKYFQLGKRTDGKLCSRSFKKENKTWINVYNFSLDPGETCAITTARTLQFYNRCARWDPAPIISLHPRMQVWRTWSNVRCTFVSLATVSFATCRYRAFCIRVALMHPTYVCVDIKVQVTIAVLRKIKNW